MRPASLLVTLLLTTTNAFAGTLYSAVDLGPYGSMASGYSITATGATAGWYTLPNGTAQAFTTNPNGTWQTLTGLQPGYDTQAYGTNASGDTAGVAYQSGGAHAALWHAGSNTPQSLGSGAATAINDKGQATGGLVQLNTGQTHAFLSNGSATQDLGTLPGGAWSSGYAINGKGQVAGYSDTGHGTFQAFLWDPSTGLTGLGTLGGRNSYGMGINAAGIVVGHSEITNGATHAFEYVNGNLHDLGTLNGTGNSYAYGINSAGSIVGYAGDAAFLFREGQMFNLNSLLTNASPYYLTAAYAINDRSQITGSALLNGVEHAIRLDPVVTTVSDALLTPTPEPSTAMMLLLGTGLLAACRRKR